MIRLFFYLASAVLICTNAENIYSQGADPEKVRTEPRPKASKPKTVPPKQTPRTKTVPSPRTKSPKMVYGSLNLQVDQPESTIFITGGTAGERSYMTKADGSPLLVDGLEPGAYKVIVRKTGFYDQIRQLTLLAGKLDSVRINLLPSLSFLSVSTNVPGANIEIENAAEFDDRIDNLSLVPGTYKITAYKNGYGPETKVVKFEVAGENRRLDLELSPLSTESMLDVAEAQLKANDPATAILLAKRVLAIQENNSKANRIIGLGQLKIFNFQEGLPFLVRAISGGESILIQVRRFDKEKGKLLLPLGQLTLSGKTIAFASLTHANLDFGTLPNEVSQLVEQTDEFGNIFVEFKAKGSFAGKIKTEHIRLYPQETSVDARQKLIVCSDCQNSRCRCQESTGMLLNLIEACNYYGKPTLRRRHAVPTIDLTNVKFPSMDFIRIGDENVSVRVPNDWQVLSKSRNFIQAAPPNGFFFDTSFSGYVYSHGIELSVQHHSGNEDLNIVSERFNKEILQINKFLRVEKRFTKDLGSRRTSITIYSGFAPLVNTNVNITVYLWMDGPRAVSVMTFVPASEAMGYESTFRRIVNSLQIGVQRKTNPEEIRNCKGQVITLQGRDHCVNN